MEPHAAAQLRRQERRRELPERTAVEARPLLRHPAADLEQARRGLRLAGAAQVEHLGTQAREQLGARLADALPAVGQDLQAQRVVARDQLLPGAGEPFEVEGGELDLLVGVRRDLAQLVGAGLADPVGLLQVGEREWLVAQLRSGDERRQRGQGAGRRRGHPAALDHRRQRFDARRFEQLAQRQVHLRHLAQAAEQARRQQRMAAEGEEVVARADPLAAEHLGHQRRQQPLGGAAGGDVLGALEAGVEPRHFRRRQGAAVDLAVRRRAAARRGHERRRHHELRQPRGEVLAQLRDARQRTLRRRDEIGDQAAVVAGAERLDGALPHPRVPRQRGLDLAQLDAEAADLDLVVDAAEVLQLAVRPPRAPGRPCGRGGRPAGR